MRPSALDCQEATVSAVANGSSRRSKENRRNSVSPTTSNSAGVARMIGLRLTGSVRRWRTSVASGSASPASGSRAIAARIRPLAAGESFGAASAVSSPAPPAASSFLRTAKPSFTGRSIQTRRSSSAAAGGTKASSRPLARPATRPAAPGFPWRAAVTPSGSLSGLRLQPTAATTITTITSIDRSRRTIALPPASPVLTPGNGVPFSPASSAGSAD